MSIFFAKHFGARYLMGKFYFGVLRGKRYSSVLRSVIVSDGKMVSFRKNLAPEFFGARFCQYLRFLANFYEL